MPLHAALGAQPLEGWAHRAGGRVRPSRSVADDFHLAVVLRQFLVEVQQRSGLIKQPVGAKRPRRRRVADRLPGLDRGHVTAQLLDRCVDAGRELGNRTGR